jgi:hypothetical protein
MQQAERPPQNGDIIRAYHKRRTGEMAQLPQKSTALVPVERLRINSRGRAYLATNVKENEAISDAIALAVARFLDVQGCYPVLIELNSRHYSAFGAHFRRYYPDASPTGIPIVPAVRDKYAVVCLGEVRWH